MYFQKLLLYDVMFQILAKNFKIELKRKTKNLQKKFELKFLKTKKIKATVEQTYQSFQLVAEVLLHFNKIKFYQTEFLLTCNKTQL